MRKKTFIRGVFYLAGLAVLAFGITLNTKTGLGVSPPVSVAYTISEIAGLNFGSMTFLAYSVFTLLEMAVHIRIRRIRRAEGKAFPLGRFLAGDLLQIPLSLAFSGFITVFSGLLPDLAADFPGTFWGSMGGRLLALLLAVVCSGIGAALSLEMRLIPNPGDGLVQSLSDMSGKTIGFVKNCFDAANIAVSLAAALLLSRRVIGIGIGTVLAMIGVGRVIALWNCLFQKRIRKAAGMSV